MTYQLYSLVFIDSSDNTAAYALSEWVIDKKNAGEFIRVMNLKKNRGKGGALRRVRGF